MTQKPQARNNFRKAERLCSHKALAELYEQGESFLAYPLRCVYRKVDCADEPLRILISVPKRNHRLAVRRNLLKRRIKEAYRLNRAILKQRIDILNLNLPEQICGPDTENRTETPANGKIGIEFSITYIAKDIQNYHTIENAVKKILSELGNRTAAAAD